MPCFARLPFRAAAEPKKAASTVKALLRKKVGLNSPKTNSINEKRRRTAVFLIAFFLLFFFGVEDQTDRTRAAMRTDYRPDGLYDDIKLSKGSFDRVHKSIRFVFAIRL